MWQIVANLEFVTGFAIDLQTRKPNISPRVRHGGLGVITFNASPYLLVRYSYFDFCQNMSDGYMSRQRDI